MLENIVIALIVLVCAVVIGRRFLRQATGAGGCGGCCKNGNCSSASGPANPCSDQEGGVR